MQSEPGTDASYSNLGVGLLGYALAEQAQTSFPDLLDQRVLAPLGMKSTTVTLDEEQASHMAGPHTADGESAHLWDLATLAGAGGVRSTIQDMLTYAAAQIAPDKTALADAIRLTQTSHTPPGEPAFEEGVGLGWLLNKQGTTLAHDGGTGGFISLIQVDLEEQVALVILTNTSSPYAGSFMRQVVQLVEGEAVKPVDLPKTIDVDEVVLQQYVGRYKLLNLGFIEIEQRDEKLYMILTGQKPVRLFANDEDSFRNRIAQSTIQFKRNAAGEVSELVLDQAQMKLNCPRVNAEQGE